MTGFIEHYLRATEQEYGQFFLIQIGAHIGKTENDPLYMPLQKLLSAQRRTESKAILVEPVPSLFKTLQSNYKSCHNVFLENAAISVRREIRDFFFFDDSSADLPPEYTELGTLNQDRAQLYYESSNPELSLHARQSLKRKKVRCLSIRDLLEEAQWTRLDFLQIDAEGSEIEILKGIDYSSVAPRFIQFESHGFSPEEIQGASAFLSDRGYSLKSQEHNFLSWKL